MVRIETTLEQMRGDYDWEEVFRYASGGNQQGVVPVIEAVVGDDVDTSRFGLADVQELYGSVSGKNDGPEWVAYGKLKDGRFFAVSAGCDYTGWD